MWREISAAVFVLGNLHSYSSVSETVSSGSMSSSAALVGALLLGGDLFFPLFPCSCSRTGSAERSIGMVRLAPLFCSCWSPVLCVFLLGELWLSASEREDPLSAMAAGYSGEGEVRDHPVP